jgi:hypothetical protein
MLPSSLGGTPTFHDTRGNDHQSVAYHFLLGDTHEGMRLCQPSDRLMVSIGETIQLVFFFADLPLNPLDAVHCASEVSDLGDQRLVAYLLEGFIDFMMESVVAAEAEQLFVGVIRRRAVIVVRSFVDITLVDDSPFVHATPHRRVHSHADFDPFGWGDASSVSGGNTEGYIVRSSVAYEAFRSGG